jgi:subtilisin family serine protease
VLNDDVRDPREVARQHAQRYGAEVLNNYEYALKGYAARLPEQQLNRLRNDSQVKYIEQDQEASVSAQTTPWGIERIAADGSQTGSTTKIDGSDTSRDVTAYILDTGIDTSHSDLNARMGVNYAGGPNTDCNGHGTHVAGTVAAKDNDQAVVGVASGVQQVGVKVLNCRGSGTYAGVIDGIDWVTGDAKGKQAIANMSLGGPKSQAVNEAVINSANSGIFYAVAAGNDSDDACTKSPASAGPHNGVMTVGATDKSNNDPSWSNFGSCVDIWAPGASILSTKKGGGTTTMSGTSMASPHVGGTGALYRSKYPSTDTSTAAANVEADIKAQAKDYGTTSNDKKTLIKVDYAGTY